MNFMVKLSDKCFSIDSVIIDTSDDTVVKYKPMFMGSGFNKMDLKSLVAMKDENDKDVVNLIFSLKHRYGKKITDHDNLSLNIAGDKELNFLLSFAGDGIYKTTISVKKFNYLREVIKKNQNELNVEFGFFVLGRE